MNTDSPLKTCILGVQMLFVAFGALVLVPLLTGLDPSIALITAGAGTLLFQAITRGGRCHKPVMPWGLLDTFCA